MKSKFNLLFATAILAMGTSGLVTAAPDSLASAQTAATATTTANLKLTRGEVRKIDLEAGKVTIKHEAIENLEMPGMTMVFKAGKPELLTSVKAGDTILFRAEKVAGAITVVDIQAVK